MGKRKPEMTTTTNLAVFTSTGTWHSLCFGNSGSFPSEGTPSFLRRNNKKPVITIAK